MLIITLTVASKNNSLLCPCSFPDTFPVNSLFRFARKTGVDGWRLALDAGFRGVGCISGCHKREFSLYFSLLAGKSRQSRVRSRLLPPPIYVQGALWPLEHKLVKSEMVFEPFRVRPESPGAIRNAGAQRRRPRRGEGQGEVETDEGPVDLRPTERTRQEAESWLSSGAGKRSVESPE